MTSLNFIIHLKRCGIIVQSIALLAHTHAHYVQQGWIYKFLDGEGYTLTVVGCLQPAKLGQCPPRNILKSAFSIVSFLTLKSNTHKKRTSQCSRPDPQTLLALPSTHAELTLIEHRRCQERILCTLDNAASFY